MTVTKTELNNELSYAGDKGPLIGVRHVQVVLMAFCVATGFATKSIFSVAIIAMTTNATSSNSDVPTYYWNNESVIISAILWSGIPFTVIGGYFGKQYGPKWFAVGLSSVNSLAFILIPVSAKYTGSTGVIVCRIVQGIALAGLCPLNTVVMGRWVPPEERSRLGYLGSAILTFFLIIASISTGFIAESPLGWPWIFYIFGSLELILIAIYTLTAVQSVNVHKSITVEERKYLQDTLFVTEDDKVIPWVQIFKSVHVWAVVIADVGLNWTVVMLTTEMPIFLDKVMKYDVKTNGIISAIPTLVGTVAGALISILSDYIPKQGILSVVNSRRIFHLAGAVGVSLTLVFMTMISVEHRIWAVVLLCFSYVSIFSSAIGGSNTNILDISPKYAGIIYGFCQTIANSIAFFGPLMIQWVCTDQTSAVQWRIVFITSGVLFVTTGIFFAIFATGQRQTWEKESEKEAQFEIQKRKASVISLSAGLGP